MEAPKHTKKQLTLSLFFFLFFIQLGLVVRDGTEREAEEARGGVREREKKKGTSGGSSGAIHTHPQEISVVGYDNKTK